MRKIKKIYLYLKYQIPVSGKVLDEKDIENLIDASLDGWLTVGRFTEEFEKSLSNYIGVRHSMFVNSGSSANLLAISALKKFFNIKMVQVTIRAVNFPTTLNPILQNNLIPVLVDADKDTYNIN